MHCSDRARDLSREASPFIRFRSLASVAFVLAITACGGSHEPTDGASVTVFAAASLAEVLPRIEPNARFNFAGSNELAAQLREGAPADVYAVANSKYPRALHQEGLLEEPVTFATNRLVVIVPESNPARISRVGDVARDAVQLVLAAEGVPAGDYTREALEQLGLDRALDNVVSNEQDVSDVLGKVVLGNADAGFVYATDAAAAGSKIRTIEVPRRAQPRIEYQIAVVAASRRRDAAEAFVRAVLGSNGRASLGAAGFGPP